MKSYEMRDKLFERGFTPELLLLELMHGISEQELQDCFKHIANMHDIELEEVV